MFEYFNICHNFPTAPADTDWTPTSKKRVKESNENEFTLTCKCFILIYELSVVVLLFLENQRRVLRS